ncbi:MULTISPECIES: ATP-dependent DNA helicase [unclassified Polaromonas]|uniref:ATP-dependent DNA helicase n=1 Tax=unclassified Polaromonas TaxID=2638319 RepID=UPI0018CBE771|nr:MULTISPECIES: ATP-dependent DNA helicase [unclassified Polaromonas]MBG6073398.1 DNA excision repair protein ERCC-2 [Polaromonas sp. CG_9.7]MBG6115417.1 DNA excision repair protein ERCC-2 [Polaromonas sp. CG_9.2]MDH6186119.1 DNA excision repair protein ERCC-2 [Polaromonas sp. CG_23.6]
MSYVVAVRALCEFTAKQGDLDLRFTPSPSAQEGIAGHALVASRRHAGYQAELSLSGDYRELHVRGRADGYDAQKNQLEEVKTFRGDLAAMPENHRKLHWAQVKVYGWLLCQKLELAEVRLALVYLDINSQQETVLTQHFTAETLKAYFEAQCEKFLHWAQREMVHRAARDDALASLAFPYAEFRTGQRELAEAVYRSATSSRCLMAQAPTGIGKTIGTVFPLLKAAPKQQIDKIFFLAAKTPGRRLALDALALVKHGAPSLPLRVIELVARDKACEHLDKACHGESCPLARGFYDRLPAARSAALAEPGADGLLDKETLRTVALAHGVCPYYLSQDLVRWSDVVVGDYNYFFDVSALLHGLTVANGWCVSVLVDEAHNLVDRARKMYSAELDQTDLAGVRQSAGPALKKPLDRLHRVWRDLARDPQHPIDQAYQVRASLPDKFLLALQNATSSISDDLEENPTRVDTALQRFYFDALHFSRMAESFGAHSLFDITQDTAQGRHAFSANRPAARFSRLSIRNVVPAPFLAPRFAAARSAALFSATLSPQNYHADTLGLPANTVWVDVPSPFLAEQLAVQVVGDISTRYQHRELSLAPIAQLMARQYQQQPGNYLVFVSSYDYLEKLAGRFQQLHSQIPIWMQTRRMDEVARDEFLARFVPEGKGIGFAVLGGAFAEGIDLPGQRLIGAFIATLGLPQVNPVNEQIKLRMAENFGVRQAYDYTYLYPGIQKVVQAAGRVIRTTQDQGVIFLMDDRFARPEVKRLLPAWWEVRQMRIRPANPIDEIWPREVSVDSASP